MNKKQHAKLLFVCVILILVVIILYSGLRLLESTVLTDGPGSMQTTAKTIVRNGVKYYPRQDLTVVLLMGINQVGKVEPTQYNHGGAADMLTLLVFDKTAQVCRVLILNRDMMVDMPVLNENGKEVGIFNGQLAYSHTYGDGMVDSCENVCKTVSNLLYGFQIDYYFSMNLDAIATLNDAVGGVEVTVEDDFSAVDPSLPMGKVVLGGQQAVTFLQTRWNVGDELNLSRMERHKVYMNSFLSAFRGKIELEQDFVIRAYEAVSDYIVTDCSVQIFGRLASDFGGFPLAEILSVEGKNILGEEIYEFYANEEALDAMILELFYERK